MNRRSFFFTAAGTVGILSRARSATGQAVGSLEDPASLTIGAAAAFIRSGQLTPIELTKACLERIERYDPKLNAFITVTPDLALEQAATAEAELSRGVDRGPLHGIPIALKDNIDTAGVRTTAASAVFADRTPTKDAEVTRRLKVAGAVLLGKLNMHEWAAGGTSVISFWGPVHNPWNLDHETGGSSGGSAAAVAADLCLGALGTDTGGSVRVPSSHCGIVGLKPTYGRVSNGGVIPLAWSRDHVGPMCKTVADAALMLQVLAGYDSEDLSSADLSVPSYEKAIGQTVKEFRLGVPEAFFYDVLEDEVGKAARAAVEVLRPMVAGVQNAVLPAVLDVSSALGAEVYAYHRPMLQRAGGRYQPATRKGLSALKEISGADYVLARRTLQKRRREIMKIFDSVDVLVTPTVKYAPRTIQYWLERAEETKPLPPEIWNTWLFNIFGLPAISIPCGFTESGLPIGLQIAGPPFQEEKVLALAHAFEQATRWHLRNPTL